MADTSRRADRAGTLDFSRPKPIGMPSLAPLYGMGPYQYRANICVIVVADAPEDAIREVLPGELAPIEGNTVAWCLFVCPDVTGIGPHSFAMPCIACRHGDFVG